MTIYFITGSKQKFLEAKAILPDLVQLELDLTEIQETDPHLIIKSKLEEAQKHKKGVFVVEDTGLYLDCLNGFPGPLIKWFLKTLGREGIAKVVKAMGNDQAQAKCLVGFYDGTKTEFFEGIMNGRIVYPKGESTFGWDPIFLPEGHNKTFAEMTKEEKNKISHRSKAFMKLRDYLN